MVTPLQQLKHPWDCSQARKHLCPSCYPLPVSKSQWPQATGFWECPIISPDSQTAWERAGRLGLSHRDCWQHTTADDCPAVPRKVPGGCFVCWYQQQDLPRLALPGLSPASAPAALHQGVAALNRPVEGGDEGKQADFPPCVERQAPHRALMLSKLPRGISKPLSEECAAGGTEAQWGRCLQKALCGGRRRLLFSVLGSRYHTALPDLLGVTLADLTSSVGDNLTRTLHRCPGARDPAEGSALKTQGWAFNFWGTFRHILAGQCLSI